MNELGYLKISDWRLLDLCSFVEKAIIKRRAIEEEKKIREFIQDYNKSVVDYNCSFFNIFKLKKNHIHEFDLNEGKRVMKSEGEKHRSSYTHWIPVKYCYISSYATDALDIIHTFRLALAPKQVHNYVIEETILVEVSKYARLQQILNDNPA